MSRTVVVTGSGSGIGAALSAMLTERGGRVIGVDLADADAAADLSTPEGRASAVARITDLSGGVVDAVVTSAGTSVPGEAMVTVNVFGTTAIVDGLQPLLARS